MARGQGGPGPPNVFSKESSNSYVIEIMTSSSLYQAHPIFLCRRPPCINEQQIKVQPFPDTDNSTKDKKINQVEKAVEVKTIDKKTKAYKETSHKADQRQEGQST